MEEQILQQKELSSELTGLNKGNNTIINRKFLIILISGVLLISLIIAIIIIFSKNRENTPKNALIIGEINCIYDIEIISQKSILLGNNFKKESDFVLYIDGIEVKYSKEFKFNTTGLHEIQIKLYSDIKMDNMF